MPANRAGEARSIAGKPAPTGPRSAASLVLFLAAAICTLILAGPRLVAALNFLPTEAAIERYFLDTRQPIEDIDRLLERARRSAAIQPDQRYWAALGLLRYIRATDTSRSLNEQRTDYENTVTAMGESLHLAPLQPRAWMIRGFAQSWLSFRDIGSVESLKMSIYSSRVEPTLFLWRLQLGLDRFRQLDAEARRLLRDQALLAWRLQSRDITNALKRGGLNISYLSQLLTPADAAVLREMEDSIAGHVR